MKREFGTNAHTLLYVKRVSETDLLHSTGNSTQYLMTTYNGKGSEKEYTYTCMAESLCYTLETNTTL